MKSFFLTLLLIALHFEIFATQDPQVPIVKIELGHECIDLSWEEQKHCFYQIERSDTDQGPFQKVHSGTRMTPRYSDKTPQLNQTYYYRVRAIKKQAKSQTPLAISDWSNTLSAKATSFDDHDAITHLQKSNFEYLWSYAHPVSGLIRENTDHRAKVNNAKALWNRCTTGATGMAFYNFAVGVQYQWITREQAAKRSLKILNFLKDKATRYHGAWAHWIHGETGETIPFSKYDNGADLVETSFLASGFIFAREYFDQDNPLENEIRKLADELWKSINWRFFSNKDPQNPALLWHWSPQYQFKQNLAIRGANECHITHLLAQVSPTHSVSKDHYSSAWLHPKFHSKRVLNKIELSLGKHHGGPLFFLHYSYLGLNPNDISFRNKSYHQHYQDLCLYQYSYAKQKKFPVIETKQLWGLTASMNPYGYSAHEPGKSDNGTITPTASLASWPYTPELSMEAFKGMLAYDQKKLWGEFGFYDAFHPKENWISPGHISIDVAPIAPMIENHLTGLCWKVFAKAPEAQAMIKLVNGL